MSDTERKLFQDGFVSAYIQRIRSMPYRSSVSAKIMNSPSAVEQMEIALGPQRAKELQNVYAHRERHGPGPQGEQGNSTTVDSLSSASSPAASAVGDRQQSVHRPGVVHALGYVWRERCGGTAAARINENVANQVAKLLTSEDRSRVEHRAQNDLAETPALCTLSACGRGIASAGRARELNRR